MKMKRILSLVLALVMILSLGTSSFASSTKLEGAVKYGLFYGKYRDDDTGQIYWKLYVSSVGGKMVDGQNSYCEDFANHIYSFADEYKKIRRFRPGDDASWEERTAYSKMLGFINEYTRNVEIEQAIYVLTDQDRVLDYYSIYLNGNKSIGDPGYVNFDPYSPMIEQLFITCNELGNAMVPFDCLVKDGVAYDY